MINTLIFDLDGLIIDSEPFWRKAEIEIFATQDIHLTDDMCRQVMGLRVDEVVKYWFSHFGKKNTSTNDIKNRIVNRVNELIEQEGTALPGIVQLVELAHSMQFKMAIASSSDLVLIETATRVLNLNKYFPLLHSAQFEQYGKPHPDIFIHTAEKLNAAPQECLVLEDSVNGVIAAKAARMKVIAIPEMHLLNDKRFGIADFVFDSAEKINQDFLQKIWNE